MAADDGVWPADQAPYTIMTNDHAANHGTIRCDAIGCDEQHPIDHEALDEPGFEFGRWIGWIYVDLNRRDVFDRELRFCSIACAVWWLEREIVTRPGRPVSPLQAALANPEDRLARHKALKWIRSGGSS